MQKLKAYKLFRVMKDGTIASLFINRKNRYPLGRWLTAQSFPTKGFKVRPFWHCTSEPFAPHLSNKGRAWYEIDIKDYKIFKRPESQGGLWYLANKIRIRGICRKKHLKIS